TAPDEGFDVFNLAAYPIGERVAASAPSPTCVVVNRKCMGKLRCQGSILPAIIQAAAHQDERWTVSGPLVSNRGSVGRYTGAMDGGSGLHVHSLLFTQNCLLKVNTTGCGP